MCSLVVATALRNSSRVMLLVASGLAGRSEVSIAILEAGKRGPPVRPAAANLADSASSLDLASA